MLKILLIDDREDMRAEVKLAVESLISIPFTLDTIDADNISTFIDTSVSSSKNTKAPEDLLAESLANNGYDLIIVDHDLSALNYGISEPVVSIASHAASIPMCRYARVSRDSNMSKLSDAIEASTVFSIKIDIANLDLAASRIINIAIGFKQIREAINSLDLEVLAKGPAFILATILENKIQEDFFAQYSISSNIMSEILQLFEAETQDGFTPEDVDRIKKDRLSYILGYWLYNTILRFPGPILNKEATCSFLNIEQTNFTKNNTFFESAKYMGPFSWSEEYWWKDKLTSILDAEDVWTGKELLEKQGISDIESCKCVYNPSLDAGFYCVIKNAPVSKEESIGGVSWLPTGATLCRIGKKPYAQLAPLLGLY